MEILFGAIMALITTQAFKYFLTQKDNEIRQTNNSTVFRPMDDRRYVSIRKRESGSDNNGSGFTVLPISDK